MDTTVFERGRMIGDISIELLQAYNDPNYPVSYGALGLVDETLAMVVIGQYLGGTMGDPVTAAYALSKFGEVAVATLARQDSRLAVTPFGDHVGALGWMGGVAYDDYVAAVSGLPQEFDRMVAALMVYSMMNDVNLHHVGYRHGSEDAMWDSAVAYARKHRTDILNRPDADHERLYIPVDIIDSRAPHGVVYIEHQFIPSKADAPEKIHLDVVTPDPEDLLRFLASAFEDEPTLLSQESEHDPIGEYLVTSKSRGIQFSVMARDRHWPVEIRS